MTVADSTISKESKKSTARSGKTRREGVPQKRDPAATRQRILEASESEFSRHGYSGARVERIATAARANIRMIYHYFGGKEGLYLAVLERVYERIRMLERQLRLETYEPVEGVRRLVEFTFDYLLAHPEFVAILRTENVMGACFLKRSRAVPRSTEPLMQAIEDLLERGRAAGLFHARTDAVQLYVTLLSLCFTHISNRHTLSVMFQRDMADPEWLSERRKHVVDVALAYLTASG